MAPLSPGRRPTTDEAARASNPTRSTMRRIHRTAPIGTPFVRTVARAVDPSGFLVDAVEPAGVEVESGVDVVPVAALDGNGVDTAAGDATGDADGVDVDGWTGGLRTAPASRTP